MSLTTEQMRIIAEKHLGHIDDDGFCTCPGESSHSGTTERTHCRIYFNEELPNLHCFHASCLATREAVLADIWRDCGRAKIGQNTHAVAAKKSTIPKAPEKPKEPKRSPLNRAVVDEILLACPPAFSRADLRARSAVPIPQDHTLWAQLLLDTCYSKGDRIIIFTEFESQGRFIYQVGRGLFLLGKEPGAEAVPAKEWPRAGRYGVWYLNHPITGKWLPTGQTKKDGTPKLSRRSGRNGTHFPYLVIESDDLPEAEWLRILAWLEIPIVAVYTSAGKSIHALIRISAFSIEQFKIRAAPYISKLSIIGADAAAMTPNRLTRLPGCVRLNKAGKDGKDEKLTPPPMQELLYLNPHATASPIMDIIPHNLQ